MPRTITLNDKIIQFPRQVAEERMSDILRGVIEQQFPTNTWRRVQFDRDVQLRTRILVNSVLRHMSKSERLKWLIQALPFKLQYSRSLAFDIMQERKDDKVA